MAQARDGRHSVGIRAAAAMTAAALAIGGVVMGTPTTLAVMPATDSAVAAGYFPAQFVNQGAEVREHIEAF
ncbi:MAG TPA: hypothetical protein VLD36_13505 [Burkholderiales bacterium]|nr:hypothetical protein [Burkholderiales bacterium]